MSTARRAIAGRTGWAVADQVLSSGTNFAVAVALARILGPQSYGAFAVGFSVWLIAMGVARTLFVQPYVIRASTADDWAGETAGVTGAVSVLGAFLGALTASVAVLLDLDPTVSNVLLALALVFPALLLQDAWRFVGFSCDRPDRSALNDLVWAVTQAVALLLLWSAGGLTATTATLAWGGGAVLAAFSGMIQFQVRPSVAPQRRAQLRHGASLGGWLTLSGALSSAGTQGVSLLVASVMGQSALGGLRASQTLFAPVQVLTMASEGVALPEASRVATNGAGSLHQLMRRYAGALLVLASSQGLFVVVAGGWLLRVVFGPEFAAFEELLVPLAANALAGAMVTSGSLAMRADQRGRSLVAAQVVGTVAKVALASTLLLTWGLVAAIWGLALGMLIHGVTLWALFHRATSAQVVPAASGRLADDPHVSDLR